MALAARPVFCQLKSQKPSPAVHRPETAPIQKLPTPPTTDNNEKIVLQPRLCALRSYGDDRAGVIKTKSGGGGDGAADGYSEGEVSVFFATLLEYIESSKNSQDFEIISGRLAMVVFAATVTMEIFTGNSLFRKMDLQGIAEAAEICRQQ